ncbi:septum formation initiator family protein [Actinocorallia longicatena]|uniref:Septum formation initiator n=1 Tax=Actinocorallia longicatena TaxID=111803 RepID=A0ABP6Q348_9ACTN
MTSPEQAGDAPRADGAGGRSHLTTRAAILAVVMCAIALSLAYPIREYVAQRNEIRALQKKEAIARKDVQALTEEKARLGDPAYVKRQAKERLHFCDVGEHCYIVLGDPAAVPGQAAAAKPKSPPWYQTLWKSVEAADAR